MLARQRQTFFIERTIVYGFTYSVVTNPGHYEQHSTTWSKIVYYSGQWVATMYDDAANWESKFFYDQLIVIRLYFTFVKTNNLKTVKD